MTDHPIEGAERLSAEHARLLAGFETRPTNDPRIRDKTLQEVAVLAIAHLDALERLSAPQSQMNEERAREILARTLESKSQGALARAIRDDPIYAMGVRAEDAIAAIQSAISEASGGAERNAVIETAATMVLGCIDHDRCRCDACNALRQAAATVRTLKTAQPTGTGEKT